MPIREPATWASDQGIPINQTTGAMAQPRMRCAVRGSPATAGSNPRIWLARLTSATMTINIARMLSQSGMASSVPRVMASMLLRDSIRMATIARSAASG